MKKSQIKNRLELKQLDISHIEQFNELLRYAFQVTDSDLHEFGWNNEEIKRSKKPILENAFVLGWFDRGNLISQIALYPMQMNIYNTIYSIGGITGVATYPEYSGIGLMADLMKQILTYMRANHQSLACLYPYSIPYYRSRGFEIVSDKMSFSFKDTQCPKPPQVNGMIQRVDENHPDLRALHNEFAAKTHGCLVRDDLAWSEYWRWDVEDTIVALYYDELDKPTGYIVYLLQNDVFKIKEMVYLNEEARYGLWGYVYAHQSMFDSIEGFNFSNHSLAFLLEDGHIKESITPYIMARIVDVVQFLEQYPFDEINYDITLCLRVKDTLLEWNNRDFWLEFSGGVVEVALESRVDSKGDRLDSEIVSESISTDSRHCSMALNVLEEKSGRSYLGGKDSFNHSECIDKTEASPDSEAAGFCGDFGGCEALSARSYLEGSAAAREANSLKSTQKPTPIFVELDIQTLTTMLLGYKRPHYLREIKRLSANDRAIDILEDIIPEGKAYFSDYF